MAKKKVPLMNALTSEADGAVSGIGAHAHSRAPARPSRAIAAQSVAIAAAAVPRPRGKNAGRALLQGHVPNSPPASAQVTRLSDPENRESLADLFEWLRSDKDHALRLLQSIGVATPTGRLTKRFGG